MVDQESQIDILVEIPKYSSNKYEYDVFTNQWKLDRVLSGSMFYPGDYGFVPQTLDYDGDPLDVICLINKPTFAGCYLPVRIIGVLKMVDGGEVDDKLLAVNAVDPRLNNIRNISDVNQTILDEITNFFLRYKELENKKVKIKGFKDKIQAESILKKCKKLYKQNWSLVNQGISKDELVKVLNEKKK